MKRKINSQTDSEKCLAKIAYKSKAEADKRAEVFKALYGTKSYAYLCPVCGCYHLATDKSPDSPFWNEDY